MPSNSFVGRYVGRVFRPGVLTLLFLALTQPSFAQSAPASAQPAVESWRDRTDLFIGLDGSKQPQDLGINANMGPRFAVNLGAPVVRGAGLGVQFGAALNLSDAAVHVLDQVDGTSRRTQVFTTLGVFQRAGRISWGVGYDALRQYYFDDKWMGQWRGEITTALGVNDQVGVWFTVPARRADAAVGETALRLAPIGQVNGMFRHQWPSGARTGLWVGLAEGHHNVVLVFPDNTRDEHVLVYGAEVSMPLNERWSITGATNLMTPTATGTVDAFMGVTFNFGKGRTRPVAFAPVLGVANNTAFSVDLSRQ
ncbi:MAG: DUF6666 family protein [Vicinamibacterales bacterium]